MKRNIIFLFLFCPWALCGMNNDQRTLKRSPHLIISYSLSRSDSLLPLDEVKNPLITRVRAQSSENIQFVLEENLSQDSFNHSKQAELRDNFTVDRQNKQKMLSQILIQKDLQ